MNKEELYNLALSDIHKYNLLNELFAIRDERFPNEQQESMLCVNGYIGIDTLNQYVKSIQALQEIKEYMAENEMRPIYLDEKFYELQEYDDILEIINKALGEEDEKDSSI